MALPFVLVKDPCPVTVDKDSPGMLPGIHKGLFGGFGAQGFVSEMRWGWSHLPASDWVVDRTYGPEGPHRQKDHVGS